MRILGKVKMYLLVVSGILKPSNYYENFQKSKEVVPMNKELYLNSLDVGGFISWILPRISGEIQFNHEYYNNRSKQVWACKSLYNAYENYEWDFTCILPSGKYEKGHTFNQSQNLLENLTLGMKSALSDKNTNNLLLYSRSVLQWGGVLRSNYNKLENMEGRVIPYFECVIERLNPNCVDTTDNFDTIYMNSGFTKLYSLLIDDFVIYDSRVGAALGFLVRKFLEDENIKDIPDELCFSYGKSRPTKSDTGVINKRNPSSSTYRFTQLGANNNKHIKNNIYANWLLSEIAKRSKFQFETNPIRALESSLFMIGYQVHDTERLLK